MMIKIQLIKFWDITESLKLDAENAGLTLTPDGEGCYGKNQPRGAYIEEIS